MTRLEFSQKLAAWRGDGAAPRPAGPMMVCESAPRRFMARFAEAAAGTGAVFLGDPAWGAPEREQVARLMEGEAGRGTPEAERGWLMIPTGGSSGRLKFARHDQDTVEAAVGGFVRHFGLKRVNAVGMLPLHHVSGLMAWLRSVLTGGDHIEVDWKAVEAGAVPTLPARAQGWVISLVPTQLERLMRHRAATEWLAQFRILFLGGAPATAGLLDRAAAAGMRVSTGYGMTETLAMAAALRPEEFLAGVRSCGTALPHARVAVSAEGMISVGGDSLFRGYFPAWREAGDFGTADLGCLDERGHLHVRGRADAVIITGGEKVHPAEVEAVLRDTGACAEIVVVGVPDEEWGQAVVAAYPAKQEFDPAKVEGAAGRGLSPWKRPKRYIPLAEWPLNDAGKVNRARVQELVAIHAAGLGGK